jgi:endonuclease/exonuclease/phosphatase family metal-dependent hydrolase
MSDLTMAVMKQMDGSRHYTSVETCMGQKIRLLSYNIQAGISTARYRHYITHSWKHVLPHAQRFSNLDRIAQLVKEYDIVGLQELDAGSLRSGYVNLTEYLSEKSGLPFWYDQTNRRFGRIARHSTGLLSRFHPTEIIEHAGFAGRDDPAYGTGPARAAAAVRLHQRDRQRVSPCDPHGGPQLSL